MTSTLPQVAERRATDDEETGLPLVLRLEPVLHLSDDQLLALCAINHELWIERNAKGELLLMPPAGLETGEREVDIVGQLWTWAKRDGSGVAVGPSGGFRLPNGAIRAADAAWVRRSRLAHFSAAERKKFLPLVPDFVIELRSPSDRLRDQQAKMDEWIANGVRLGWLLDPEPHHVYVYRPGAPVARLDDPTELSADPLLPGFVLDLREIW
ncbi:MAG: Uma2 family endonuclease [Chloroflexi bacterium]|nr:Uma2 family endonuclease [Chloroflexota bacterium]